MIRFFRKRMHYIMLNESCQMIIIKLYLFSLKFRKYPTAKVKFYLKDKKFTRANTLSYLLKSTVNTFVASFIVFCTFWTESSCCFCNRRREATFSYEKMKLLGEAYNTHPHENNLT